MHRHYFEHRLTFDRKRSSIWQAIAAHLQKEIPEDGTVLDLGAGYCDFINNIKAKEKHALDTFEKIREYADSSVKVHLQPSTSMKGLKTGDFDVVFASNFFEHLTRENVERTLLEVRRILKKNGKLILLQPNFKYAYKEYFDDYTHISAFTETGMADMLKSMKFKIAKCHPRFLPFSMKSRLNVLSPFLPLYLKLPLKPFAKQMLIIAQKD